MHVAEQMEDNFLLDCSACTVPPLKVSDSFASYGADTLMYPPREWWFRYELLCTAK